MKILHLDRPDQPQGFTLVELITATAIMGVVVSMVWGGLISVMESNQRKSIELDRKHELNRAADFILDDIRAGSKISTTVTLSGPNQGLFEVTQPDGSVIAYYVTTKGDSRWRGPYILMRKASGMSKSEALIDGISTSLPLHCWSAPGDSKRKAGIRIAIQNNQHVNLCLAGNLVDDEILTVTRQANVRN